MNSHLSYPTLSDLLAKYPKASNSLFQAYNDIVYAQQWNNVEVVDLTCCLRGAIRGTKRDSEELLYVVPCSLSETLSFSWLQDAFRTLFPHDDIQDGVTLPFLYLAITLSDSSIVYYKISQGMIKPSV